MPRYSRKRIRDFLDRSDGAASPDEKGDILEQLTRYVFEQIPGVTFHGKNILDGKRAHELDVVFWNNQPKSDLWFIDAIVIVECKNTAHPVGSQQVGWFVRKLQDRGAAHGILVALDGITGNDVAGNSARSEVVSALVRDKIRVMVVTREELLALGTTNDLVNLLQQKLLQLTLQGTVG
jgi:hypothetical protein